MNNHLTLFLPCAAGVEDLLANEVAAIAADHAATAKLQRGGVRVGTRFGSTLVDSGQKKAKA